MADPNNNNGIESFFGLASVLLGAFLPPNNNVEAPPLSSAPCANSNNSESNAHEIAKQAADRARAAAAAAAALVEKAKAEAARVEAEKAQAQAQDLARAEAERAAALAQARVEAQAQARAEAERAAALAEAAALAQAQARVEAQAKARAEAKARAQAQAQAEAQALAQAEAARAEAARAEAQAQAEAARAEAARAEAQAQNPQAVDEKEVGEKVDTSSLQPLANAPKPNSSYSKFAKLMTPGAVSAGIVTCVAVGISSIATFGAVPLAIGIAIGVGSIAYYSRTRKNSSEVESNPKEAESEEDIKIKKLEGLFQKNGDFKDKYFKKDGKFAGGSAEKNEFNEFFKNNDEEIDYSNLSKEDVDKYKEIGHKQLRELKAQKIKRLYGEKPIEILEELFQKNGRFKKEYEEDLIKKAELKAILIEIDPNSYSDPFEKVDGENKTDSKKIDYSRLNSIAREELHRLKADKVINSFVDENKAVYSEKNHRILNVNFNYIDKRKSVDKMIEESIEILNESKAKHDKTKDHGQNLINFDATITELNKIKESYESKQNLYPSLPSGNDRFKDEKMMKQHQSEKKQKEIEDFGKSSTNPNRSKVDDLKEKIEELKHLPEKFPCSEECIKKQKIITEMAQDLIKEKGGSLRKNEVNYSERLKECLGKDAAWVRNVGKNSYGQTVIDTKSIFDENLSNKPRTSPGKPIFYQKANEKMRSPG